VFSVGVGYVSPPFGYAGISNSAPIQPPSAASVNTTPIFDRNQCFLINELDLTNESRVSLKVKHF
jgi:hypothetical protein